MKYVYMIKHDQYHGFEMYSLVVTDIPRNGIRKTTFATCYGWSILHHAEVEQVLYTGYLVYIGEL